MSKFQEKFEMALQDSGRSITKSRVLLFKYLQESGPISPKQFLEDNLAIADRASLYRTLTMFKQIGIIEERIVGGRRLIELTDTYDSHHHHLTCASCGKSTEITMPHVEEELLAICKAKGFKVERHVIEVDGLCCDCSN